MSDNITMEQAIRDVLAELDLSPAVTDRAVEWARITLPNAHKMTRQILTPAQAEIMRQYFRALLHRMTFDPEFRKQLKRDIQERIERN